MAGRDALCAYAAMAGHDLDLCGRTGTATAIAEQLRVPRHRLRILLDVLVYLGAMSRTGEIYAPTTPPPRVDLPRTGWGLIAEIIRSDRPLPLESGRSYQEHLVRAGAEAARELAPLLAGGSLLDLGAGAGTYTEAFLDAHPQSTATLVDTAEVIAFAAERLRRFGDRITFIAGDARDVFPKHDTVLVANLLHLHGERVSAEIIASAIRAGGRVVVKDLRIDEDRRGPLEGLLFALGMAIYTEAGDVHRASTIRKWLGEATEHHLKSTDHLVLIREPSPFDGLDYPPSFQRVLDRAIRDEPTLRAPLLDHYAIRMPAARRDEPALFQVELDWEQLPRLRRAIDRLYTVLAEADVPPLIGPPTSAAFFTNTPTLSALYARTHYGGAMPLLYGHESSLAYFASHGLSPLAQIDRYLVAPIVHELSHLHRAREGVPVVHLDECLAGWLGVHVHRELAYPAPGHDDALYGAPWLAQVGQAIARRFGIRAAIRAHAGVEPLPIDYADFGWADWRARKTLHFLSDTMDPVPWIELILHDLPDDPAFDRIILEDALTAMCLENTLITGSVRTRLVPTATATLRDGWLVGERRGIDTVAPRYWVPPRIARLSVRELHVTPDTNSEVAAALVEEAE